MKYKLNILDDYERQLHLAASVRESLYYAHVSALRFFM